MYQAGVNIPFVQGQRGGKSRTVEPSPKTAERPATKTLGAPGSRIEANPRKGQGCTSLRPIALTQASENRKPGHHSVRQEGESVRRSTGHALLSDASRKTTSSATKRDLKGPTK